LTYTNAYKKVTRKTWSEWLTAFLEADAAAYHTDEHAYENDDWDPMPGGDYDGAYEGDIDDGLLESIFIILLAGTLALLVVYRRRRADERQGGAAAAQARAAGGEQHNDQARGDGDGGLFPQPGDPDFAGWAVGGVGH
jgi:SEL1 protein